tara:strand:- start:682 stop:798 length:117 start_codon:yes stop_codon:yes gene_type:complete
VVVVAQVLQLVLMTQVVLALVAIENLQEQQMVLIQFHL